jgi:hypothetical protein
MIGYHLRRPVLFNPSNSPRAQLPTVAYTTTQVLRPLELVLTSRIRPASCGWQQGRRAESSMGKRLAKSCDNCRVAKVRCSLSTPCLRCAKRHLECNYARSRLSDRRFAEGFRLIKPAVNTPVGTRTGTAEAPSGQLRAGVEDASNREPSACPQH